MRAVWLVVLLAACFHEDSTLCEDGSLCPPGLKCVMMGCALSTCGNGLVDEGELCDDGNNVSGDGCGASCGPACGDGVTDSTEVCDDGNAVDGDGCAANCRSDETCGNGVIDPGEGCDDDNLRSHDSCSSRCTVETLAWTSLDDAPTVTGGYALAYDAARGTIILFGGTPDHGNQLGETWEWDATQWRRRVTPTAPKQRRNPLMAFDTDRNRIVMFGGLGFSEPLHDTWEWDGATWIPTTPTTSPPVTEAAMVYDAARHRTVLFGGLEDTVPSNATWTWDGANWSVLTTAHVPPARSRHAMAYDVARERIVLFGGLTNTVDESKITWELDGQDWIERSVAVSPRARGSHAMTYDTVRRVVVMTPGLPVGAMEFIDDTAEWDGTRWTVRAGPTPIHQYDVFNSSDHAAVFDARIARVVQFGPTRVSTGLGGWRLRVTWMWDGTGWRTRRDNADLVAPYNGGEAATLWQGAVIRLDSAESELRRWDGASWSFAARAGSLLPYARSDAAFATTPAGAILVGGLGGGVFGDAWTFNGEWYPVTGTTPPARFGAAMTAIGSQALLFGGRSDSGPSFDDTWIWSGMQFVKATPATVPPKRGYAAMAYDSTRDRVVMVGGSEVGLARNDAWEWDGANWGAVAVPPIQGNRIGLVFDTARNRIVLVTDRLWDWDGTTWLDRGAATALPAGGHLPHTAVYVPGRDRIVVFGASEQRGPEQSDATVIEWDGTTWSADVASPDLPAARVGHAMVTDTVRHTIAMYGGRPTRWNDYPLPVSRAFADLWSWEGQWVHHTSNPSPGPRSYPAMAFDEDRGQIVLHGGGNQDGFAQTTTWVGDGAMWSPAPDGPRLFGGGTAHDLARGQVVVFGSPDQMGAGDSMAAWNGAWQTLMPTQRPSARGFTAMAYDRRRARIILFGGQSDVFNDATVLGDLWEWDGTSWELRTLAASTEVPRARSHHAIVWDNRRQKLVLFGGMANGIALDDAWEWDGTSWTRSQISGSPGARFDPAMTEDPRRGGLVMFGGADQIIDALAVRVVRQTWFLRADDPAVPDEACLPGMDGDGDGKIGCDDPDCPCP